MASGDHDARYARLAFTNSVPTGDAFIASTNNGSGIVGITAAGIGVRGFGSTGMVAIGSTTGMWATTTSLNLPAAMLDAPDGGRILVGRSSNNVEKFSVDAAGTVVASKFVGDGSALTGVVATAMFPERKWLPAGSCPPQNTGCITLWQNGNGPGNNATFFTAPQGVTAVITMGPGHVIQQLLSLPDDFESLSAVKVRWISNGAGTTRWNVAVACVPDGGNLGSINYSLPSEAGMTVTAAAGTSLSMTVPVPQEAQSCPAGAMLYLRLGRGTSGDDGVPALFVGAEITINRQ